MSKGAGAGPEMDDGYGFEKVINSKVLSHRELRLRVKVVGRDDDAPGGSLAGRKRGREEDKGDDGEDIYSSCTVTSTPVLRVETMYVSSAILAAKSNFFFKLFSNGMGETAQKQATVIIPRSEKESFMELLHFMYSGQLAPTTEPTLLVDILMAAYKFEVVSCMKLCRQRLKSLPMTQELAVRCLNLPCSFSMAAGLIEAAKKFVAERYKEFLSTKFQDELMRIPLGGIVAILSRNDLGIASEVAVYDFVLRWACSACRNSEERQKILTSHLLPLVRLRMTDAISFLDGSYSSRTVSVAVNREECCSSKLFHGTKRMCAFTCARHGFVLSVHRVMDRFGCSLFLETPTRRDNGPTSTVYYQLEAKTRPLLEFVTRCKGTFTDSNICHVKCDDLFHVPWSEFIADDSPFFVDGTLHLQVNVKIKQEPQ